MKGSMKVNIVFPHLSPTPRRYVPTLYATTDRINLSSTLGLKKNEGGEKRCGERKEDGEKEGEGRKR